MADAQSLLEQAIQPDNTDLYQVAASRGTPKGTASMTGLEQDVRTLTHPQLLAKYGQDTIDAVVVGNIEYAQDVLNTARSPLETAYDLGLDAVTGLAMPIASLGALGLSAASPELGASMASDLGTLNEWLQGTQSEAVQAARRVQQAKQVLDTRDNKIRYNQELQRGDNETLAGAKLLGRNAVSSISNTVDSGILLGQGTATASGSILAGGLLTKGITGVSGLALTGATKAGLLGSTKTIAQLSRIGRLAAWPLVIGAMEGGGAYQEVAAEILEMSFDDLAKNSPEFPLLVQNYQNQGISLPEAKEQARVDIASSAGYDAALKQGIAGAATGTLTRWAEKPFHVAGGLRGLAKNAMSEVVEESIQGGTGRFFQNKAIQEYADVTRDTLEGIGEEIGQSALFSLGSVGAIQGPSLVAEKTSKATSAIYKGTKAVGGAIVNRADTILTNLETKANAPVQQKAATLAPVAKEVLATATTVINQDTNTTPEQKNTSVGYVDNLVNSLAFEDKANYTLPKGHENIFDNVTNRLQALSKIAQAYNKAEKANNIEEAYNLAVLSYQVNEVFEQIALSDTDALQAIPDDSSLGKIISQYEQIAATSVNTPAMQKMSAKFQEMLSKPEVQNIINQQATSLDPSNTQQVQQAIKTAEIINTVSPEKGNEALNNKLLTLEQEGAIALSDTQRASLQVSINLIKAAKQVEAERTKAGKLSPRDVVSGQILGNETSDTNRGKDAPSKLSAAGHTRNILSALKAGNVNLASEGLQDFGMFVQHMRNKLEAINKHLLAGSPKERQPWNRLIFEGGQRVWKASTGMMSQAIWPNSPNSVSYAQNVAFEANILTDIYNGLVEAYPFLQQTSFEPMELATTAQKEAPVQPKEVKTEVSQPPVQEIKKEALETKPEPQIVEPVEKKDEFVTWDNIQKDMQVTLYRGESLDNIKDGNWWTTNKSKAEKYGKVQSITISSNDIGKHAVRGHGGIDEFFFTGKSPSEILTVKEETIEEKTKRKVDYEISYDVTLENGRVIPIQTTRMLDGSVEIHSPKSTYNFTSNIANELTETELLNKLYKTDNIVEKEKIDIPRTTAFSYLIPKAKSLMEKVFTFSKSEKNRFASVDNPIQTISEALKSADSLKRFLGKSAYNDVIINRLFKDPETLKVYTDLLDSDNTNSLVYKINSVLHQQLDEFLNKKNGDENNLMALLGNKKAVNEYQNAKAANILVDDGTNVFYEPKLIQLAILAAVQSYISLSQHTKDTDTENIAKFLELNEHMVTDDMVNMFSNTLKTDTLKFYIANNIKQFWGVLGNKDMPYGYVEGIPEALAAELLKAMSSKPVGLFDAASIRIVSKNNKLLAYDITFPKQKAKAIPEDIMSQKPTVKDYALFRPVFPIENNPQRNLFNFQDAISSLVLQQGNKSIYYNDSIPPVAQTQLRNSNIENTPQQKEAIGNLNHEPFKVNMPMVNFFNTLGLDNIIKLFSVDIGDGNQWNDNHIKTLQGQNITISSAFADLQMSMQDMTNYAKSMGIPISEVVRHYSYNVHKLGRFQMLGAFNPQNSKLLRTIFMPTESTIDMNMQNSDNALYYHIALAQAIGIKVHQQALDKSETQVKDLLTNEFADVLSDLQEWLKTETVLPSNMVEKIQQAFKLAQDSNKKAEISFDAIYALVDYARLQNTKDKSKFNTMMFLEADGVTNGLVNAMMILNHGPLNVQDLQNLRKGGVSIGSNKTYAEIRELDGKDLYTTIGEKTSENILNELKVMQSLAAKPDVSKLTNEDEIKQAWRTYYSARKTLNQYNSLFNLFEMFGEGALQREVDEKQQDLVNLTIDRSIVKNPATIITYGAGLDGIAGNLIDSITTAIYQEFSAALQRQQENPQLSIAEALFPNLSKAEAINQYENNLLKTLKDLSENIIISGKFGTYVKTAPNEAKFPAQINLKEFTFTKDLLENMQANMRLIFVDALNNATYYTLGDSLLSSAASIQKCTSVQSIIYKYMYAEAIQNKLKEIATDKTRTVKNFLSENELLEIRKKLTKIEPIIYVAGQVFSANKSTKTTVSGFDLRGNAAFDDTLRSSPNTTMPTEAGVLGIAMLNVGSGDARMIQIAASRKVPGLNVFDGWHMAIDKVKDVSNSMNQAVYDSWKVNTPKSLLRTYDRMLSHFFGSEQGVKDFTALITNTPKLAEEIARNFMSARMLDEFLINHPEGFSATQIMRYMLNSRNELADIAASIDARHKTFQTLPVAIDQMASGATPYSNKTERWYEAFVGQSDAKIAEVFKAIYTKNYIPASPLKRIPSIEKIMDTVTTTKYIETSGVVVESSDSVFDRLTKNKNDLSAPLKHILTMLKRNPLFKDKEYTFVTSSPEAVINFLQTNEIESPYTVEMLVAKQVKGFLIPNSSIIWFNEAKTNDTTYIHEMIHAVTMDTLVAYYDGSLQHTDETTTQVVSQAIENLEMLADEFLQMPYFDDVTAATRQHHVQNIMTAQDRTTVNGQAKFLGEFMAYILSSQSQIDELTKRKSSSPLVQFLFDSMEVMKKFFTKIFASSNTIKASFWEQVRFNTDVIMKTQPTLVSRFNDATLAYNDESDHASRLHMYRKKISEFLSKHTPMQDTLAKAQQIQDTQAHAQLVLNTVKAHDFNLNAEQQAAFQYMVQALSTELSLDSATLTRAHEIYSHVTKTLDWSDLLTVPADQATIDQETIAQNQYDIILGKNIAATDKQGRSSLLSTFMGLAMVSPEFRNTLSKMEMPKSKVSTAERKIDRVIENLGISSLNKITSRLSGEKQAKNVMLAMDNLFNNFKTILDNEQKLLNQGINTAGSLYDIANEKVRGKLTTLSLTAFDKLGNLVDNVNNPILKTAGTLTRGLVGLANDTSASIVSESVTTFINNHNLFDGINAFVSDLVGRTKSNANVYDMIKLVKATVQQLRQNYRDSVPHIIKSKFKTKLTSTEWSSLYRSMAKIDLACLSIPLKTIHTLMKSETALASEILRYETKFTTYTKDKTIVQTRIAKAKQLAHFMVTGEAGIGLLRNAYAIISLNKSLQPANIIDRTGITNVLDELVTLYALKELPRADKQLFSSLVQNELEGINFTLSYLKGQRIDEKRKSTNYAQDINNYKGYIPTLNQQGTSLIVAKDTDSAQLLLQGYVRVGDYQGSTLYETPVKQGYYFSPITQKAIFNQGIFQTINKTVNGTDSITGFTTGNVATRIISKAQVDKINKAGVTSNWSNNALDGLIPVFSKTGKIVGYERLMDNKQLARLNQDTNLANMIGVWRGRQVEEALATKVNEELIHRMHEMYQTDVVGGTRTENEYIDLFDNSKLTTVQKDAVSLLSNETLEYAKEVFGDKFYVRKDMFRDAIGERAISINEFWSGISNINPKTQDAMRKALISIFGVNTYKYLMQTEQFVQSTVSSARNLIVVKSMVVPALNILANVYQLVSRGVPIKSVLGNIPKKIYEIESYTSSLRRKIAAEAELRATTISRDKLKLQAEIQAINDSHRRMSIWPLIEAGEFSTIADLGMSKDDLQLTAGNLTGYLEKLVDKLPANVKTAGKYALITEDTALYRGLFKAVQYGDFIAKAILYDDLITRQKKSKDEARGTISEEFVNYDKSPGRARQYAENIGLMWFFNFKIRISKIALSTLRNNPLHALLGMALPSSSPFGSIGFTLDDNLFAKILQGKLKYTLGWGMGFRAPQLHPWLSIIS